MRLLIENVPAALLPQWDSLAKCIAAMEGVSPIRNVYLFGSYARGEATDQSDVDLCIVADGAERQRTVAAQWREAIWGIWPRPSLTLIPITPERLAEKQGKNDHFFTTVFKEGVLIASED